MKSNKLNNIIFIRLHPNENLIESIKKICKKYEIKTGIILSGIGQIKNVTLGYFKEKNDYSPTEFLETYELLSLNGSIIKKDDEYLPHFHVVIGDINKHTFGGHLIDATVEVTNEIAILETNINAIRKTSETTGLMELDFKDN